jgi:hypothetical protein
MFCLTYQPALCGVGPMAREATVERRLSRVTGYSTETGYHKRLLETMQIRGSCLLESMMKRRQKDLNSTMNNFLVIVMLSRGLSLSSGPELKLIKGMLLLLDSMISNWMILITITSCLLSVTKRI